MGFTIWLLCLQASLLSHALECSAAQGELSVSKHTADAQYEDQTQQSALPLPEGLVLFRRRRQLERRGPTHMSHNSRPGAFTAKGFPNTLIQADRSRRHLKKKPRKSRAGTYSLLSNDKRVPLQVIRVRRQEKLDPQKRVNSGRSGAFSVLGDPQADVQADDQADVQTDRPNRSIQKRSAGK
ncbi:uncharacterized protein si:dkey-12l12.1 [Trematomus bernacchii]|uniref:uncharacterized protein si:dkey-12l12.1 n=1 Tax=Trematomus bernacchii TaxID=40690 RepID=UPI00146BF17C|nr:uncharacterized protein si:dkey-12l12.1 [Trematomus bernacchii]